MKPRASVAMACVLAPALWLATMVTASAQAPTAKEVVSDFYELAFVQGHAVEAAEKYISPDKYVQHNPQAGDGRQAFIKGFAAFVAQTGYRCQLKRVVAEGDLVVTHGHCKQHPAKRSDRGAAVFDIFRVEQGRITEHWDAEQPVPAKSQNANTMF
jgi:predicted SnoaL-like aldol condensation-catalyzing enzyme